jgi:alpha-D-xyloside xylohydrolase
VPADEIHLDTGWFETDWRSDYRFRNFALSRIRREMMAALSKQRFSHPVSWQYTYFHTAEYRFVGKTWSRTAIEVKR